MMGPLIFHFFEKFYSAVSTAEHVEDNPVRLGGVSTVLDIGTYICMILGIKC